MAWESFTTGNTTGITSTGWVTLFTATGTPREIINVFIGADNKSGTITDALQVRALIGRDATPTNFTDVPGFGRSYLPATTGEEYFPFSLFGYEHYRVQGQSEGATDDYNVNHTYRGDGVDA